MKTLPLILLFSSFLFVACQEDKNTEKAPEVATTTAQKAEKTEVAKAEETKTEAKTKTAVPATTKKTEEAEEESGAALHQKNCSKCHGKDYYPKKDSKMDSYARLHKMVGMCDAQLGTELFPEELQSITDYLNDSFYKFKKD